jgi:hypothetical protein
VENTHHGTAGNWNADSRKSVANVSTLPATIAIIPTRSAPDPLSLGVNNIVCIAKALGVTPAKLMEGVGA